MTYKDRTIEVLVKQSVSSLSVTFGGRLEGVTPTTTLNLGNKPGFLA